MRQLAESNHSPATLSCSFNLRKLVCRNYVHIYTIYTHRTCKMCIMHLQILKYSLDCFQTFNMGFTLLFEFLRCSFRRYLGILDPSHIFHSKSTLSVKLSYLPNFAGYDLAFDVAGLSLPEHISQVSIFRRFLLKTWQEHDTKIANKNQRFACSWSHMIGRAIVQLSAMRSLHVIPKIVTSRFPKSGERLACSEADQQTQTASQCSPNLWSNTSNTESKHRPIVSSVWSRCASIQTSTPHKHDSNIVQYTKLDGLGHCFLHEYACASMYNKSAVCMPIIDVTSIQAMLPHQQTWTHIKDTNPWKWL